MPHMAAGDILSASQYNSDVHQGYRLLAEQVIETSTSSVIFSSINQNYRMLQMFITGGVGGVGGTQIDLQFNGDTGNNYDHCVYVMRANDVFAAFPITSDDGIEVAFFSDTLLVNSASFVVSGYTRTDRNKLLFGQAAAGIGDLGTNNANAIFNHMQGQWKSQSAITQIDLVPRTGDNIAPGSIFQLYGLGAE